MEVIGEQTLDERDHARRAISVLDECFGIVFDRAPVMMHAVDGNGVVVRVNRRWTDALGYANGEVVGRKSVEFLTEQSRAQVIDDTMPLFWRTGHARSIGLRFVRKDGQVVDLMLDAEVSPHTGGVIHSYAVLYDPDDTDQWKAASKTLRELKALINVQRRYENVLSAEAGAASGPASDAAPRLPGLTSEPATSDVMAAFLEVAQDTSVNLRTLARLHEELVSAAVEYQPELMLVLKSIDKTLTYLADGLESAPWMSQ